MNYDEHSPSNYLEEKAMPEEQLAFMITSAIFLANRSASDVAESYFPQARMQSEILRMTGVSLQKASMLMSEVIN
jgi:hypothetical protein